MFYLQFVVSSSESSNICQKQFSHKSLKVWLHYFLIYSNSIESYNGIFFLKIYTLPIFFSLWKHAQAFFASSFLKFFDDVS